jgi:predicted AAA+ superfamily ATPase
MRVDAGDRIISLQTAFGGGKTHTLVALWHLVKHASILRISPHTTELRCVLGDRFPETVRGVAVFTNATCDVTQGRKTPEGIRTRTLWGELAVQLGGPSLYEKVRANDETQRVPQGIFVEVLREAAPCLILLDELADYCVGAAAVPVGDTTLADQTISFVQQLTEAVQQVPGAVVVATLPASKYEVAQSEKGQEAFVTLEKRFQRLGADVKPVADDEIYEVVRARLFESITPTEEPDYPIKVARVYQEMYAAHSGEVPNEASKKTYREQIARAYPFHPLLIDALYTRWGSHPDFQRTRGVLRLLASIVGDLWQRREGNTQTQHLIQPATLGGQSTQCRQFLHGCGARRINRLPPRTFLAGDRTPEHSMRNVAEIIGGKR